MKKPGYTPVGATPEKKTKRIAPPTNQDGKYNHEQLRQAMKTVKTEKCNHYWLQQSICDSETTLI